MKPVSFYVKNCRSVGCNTPIDRLYLERQKYKDMYGSVLMACVGHQSRILSDLWAHLVPQTPQTLEAWRHICRNGDFVKCIDTSDPEKVLHIFMKLWGMTSDLLVKKIHKNA